MVYIAAVHAYANVPNLPPPFTSLSKRQIAVCYTFIGYKTNIEKKKKNTKIFSPLGWEKVILNKNRKGVSGLIQKVQEVTIINIVLTDYFCCYPVFNHIYTYKL